MIKAIFLDTTPLGLIAKPPGQQANVCFAWVQSCLAKGIVVYVPEIADYEVRRELIRIGAAASVARLENMKILLDYLPLTTLMMQKAAELWAQARNAGISTADKHALDGDVTLCAQSLSLGLAPSEFVVSTSNVKHLSRFVPAEEWANIQP